MDDYITHNGRDYVHSLYLDIHLRLQAEELAGAAAEFLFSYVDWELYTRHARME